MAFPTISTIVFISIIIILILIMIFIIFDFKKVGNGNTPIQSIYGWDNPPLGTCNVYQFPTTFDNSVYNKANPSYNILNTIGNSLINTTYSDLSCMDYDLLNATNIQHTCSNAGIGPNASTLTCYNQEGTIVNKGATESIYVNCTIPQCQGNLSLISIGYKLGTSYCLNKSLNAVDCNPSDPTQQWRITRKSTNTDDISLDQTGLLTQIYDRDSNNCLTLTSNPSQINTFDSSILSGCNNSVQLNSTFTLSLGACGNQGNFSDGFFWYILPTTNQQPTQLVFVADGNTSINIPQSITQAQSDLLNNNILVFDGVSNIYPVQMNNLPYNYSDTNSVCTNLLSNFQPFNLSNESGFNSGFNIENTCFPVNNTTFNVTTNCLNQNI